MPNAGFFKQFVNRILLSYNRFAVCSATLLLLSFNIFGQAPEIRYTTPNSYFTGAQITPLTPVNTGGAIPASAYAKVTTIAGSLPGYQDGPGVNAYFNQPAHITIDSKKNLYVTDVFNYVIRKITPSGLVSTFAGNGTQGDEQGTGTAARFSFPIGIVADKNDNLFVADYFSNKIKKITPLAQVSDYAGSGANLEIDGQGVMAGVASPSGLAIDPNGNLYFTTGRQTIRKIDATGMVSFLAGSGSIGFANGQGSAASFHNALGPSADKNGNLFVADESNHRIRMITSSGYASTVAGTGSIGSTNGAAGNAEFNYPEAVTVDNLGNIYVADGFNNQIRKISNTGLVTTLAGSGVAGRRDASGLDAEFNVPSGLITDNEGSLFIVDSFNSAIRKLSLTGYIINKALPPGLSFDATTGIVSGIPSGLFPLTQYTVTGYNVSGSSSTTFSIEVLSNPLLASIITFPQPNITLDANSNFSPGATSTNLQTPIEYSSSNTAVATVTADGKIHVISPGTTLITASQMGNSVYDVAEPVSRQISIIFDQQITFSAITDKTTCDPSFLIAAISSNPSISLQYSSSNPQVATIDAQANISIIGAGTVTITVSQPGNAFYHPASPINRDFRVNPPPSPIVAITPDKTSACIGEPVTFRATVTQASGVTFYWSRNGQATGTNSSLLLITDLISSDKISCKVITLGNCPQQAVSEVYTGFQLLQDVVPLVSITVTPSEASCVGTELHFSAQPVNGGNNPIFNWKINGQAANGNGAYLNRSNLRAGDAVTCEMTSNASPCLTLNTALSNTLTVNLLPSPDPLPVLTISSSDNHIYSGTTVTFTATAEKTSLIIKYQWEINGLPAGSNSPRFTTNQLKNGDQVTCIITLNFNCGIQVSSEAINMIVNAPPALHVVNSFTPNGDGINDLWSIPDLYYYPGCSVSIFSRNGQEIFHSQGYSKAWDGSHNGKAQPAGVYYFIIDIGPGQRRISGSLTLLR